MTGKTLGVGFIGVEARRSWSARARIPALQALSDRFHIAGIANSSAESGQKAAAAAGIKHAFTSVDELISSPDVDIVAVTVKVPAHYDLVVKAIEAGKHVYCEWPLGNGLEEAIRLIAAVENAASTGRRQHVADHRGFVMIVLMSWTRRKPSMTHDEYMDYWFNKHAPLVKSVSEFTRHVRKYAQYHLPDKSKASASPFGPLPDHEYDGVVAVWFDSYEEMEAAFKEPRYLEVIRPDELKFGDATHSTFFIVEEFEIHKA